MSLFLRDALVKGDKRTEKRGELRGGKYAARIQVGYNQDGTPKYKYFESFEARDKYLKGKDPAKEIKEDKTLEEKTDEERDESKKKTEDTQGKVKYGKRHYVDLDEEKDRQPGTKDRDPLRKSQVPVFIWSFDV